MPRRLRDILRVLRARGFTLEHGSKHFKVRGLDGRMYTIPAGNGEKTEIGNEYIRGLCRTFPELDLAELMGIKQKKPKSDKPSTVAPSPKSVK